MCKNKVQMIGTVQICLWFGLKSVKKKFEVLYSLLKDLVEFWLCVALSMPLFLYITINFIIFATLL